MQSVRSVVFFGRVISFWNGHKKIISLTSQYLVTSAMVEHKPWLIQTRTGVYSSVDYYQYAVYLALGKWTRHCYLNGSQHSLASITIFRQLHACSAASHLVDFCTLPQIQSVASTLCLSNTFNFFSIHSNALRRKLGVNYPRPEKTLANPEDKIPTIKAEPRIQHTHLTYSQVRES